MDKEFIYIIIIGLLASIIFGVFIFFVMVLLNKKKHDALKNLSNDFPGTVIGSFLTLSFKGEYKGLKFSIVLMPESKNSPSYLRISLQRDSSFTLSMYKESILSGIGKKVRLVHEVNINDESFDKAFLIFSNNPTRAIPYLNNLDRKNTIKRFFDDGFNYLLIRNKETSIQKPNYFLEYDLNPSRIKEIIQKLVSLTEGLY